MERDCRENTDIDSMKASGIYQCENIQYLDENDMQYFNNHSVMMDGQLDAATYMDEERLIGCLTISEPSTTTQPILASKRKSGKSTKSSSNVSSSKFSNQIESSGQQPVSNEVSNARSKPGLRASRRANAEKQEGHLVQTQQNTAWSTEKASTSIWRKKIEANSPCKISSTSNRKTQPHRSSTSQQVQAQQSTTLPTKKPKSSTDKLVQAQQRSTSSTNEPSPLVWKSKVEANPPSKISSTVTEKSQVKNNSTGQLVQSPESRTTSNKNPSPSVQRSRVQANPPSEISSPAIMKMQSHKNSVGQPVQTQQITKQSTKKPSTLVQRSTVQANSSPKLSSTADKKTHFQKDSSPQKVWREKTKKQTSTSEPKRSRNLRPTSPIYHITWDGFERTCESVTENCAICERDLSSSSKDWELKYYDEYEDDLEPAILSDVAVLACGHVFHSECLQSFVPEDQSSDPLCFLCLSTRT